jgi:Protein of unknown function (DUF1573)
MTMRWCSALVAALAVGLALARQPAQKPTARPPAKPWANKMFLPNIDQNPAQDAPAVIDHQFGTVPFGSLLTHTFTLSNIYDVPMQVIDIRTECGCLKAYPPNKVLQPNEKAEFTVTMNAGAFKGANTKRLIVTVGPNYLSQAELRFSATSREDVAVTPGQVDFGIVQQGAKATKAVILKYTGRERNWKVTEYTTTGTAYDLEVKESARGFLSTDYTLTVSLKDTAPAGPLSDQITLKTNDPATPTVTVGIGGVIQPPVSVASGQVEFRGVKVGESATAKAIVRANADCTLTPVADDGDGVSVETFPARRQVHIVTVRYEPKKDGGVRKELKLKTDLPGNPEVILVVEAK